MSKMAEIDQSIKDIKQWIKRNIYYIIVGFIIIVIAILVYGQANVEKQKVIERETRINNIEERLTKQERYMDQVEADIDNIYKRMEID